MFSKQLFFKRTISILENSGFNISRFNDGIDDKSFIYKKLEEKLSREDCLVAFEIYSYECDVHSFFLPFFKNKQIFEQRIDKALKIEKIVLNGKAELLENTFEFNRKNLMISTELDLKAETRYRSLSVMVSQGKLRMYYVKPSLMANLAVNEIYLEENKFDYLLVDLYQLQEGFTGNELLNALKEKYDSLPLGYLTSLVLDKLLQYLLLFDALEIRDL